MRYWAVLAVLMMALTGCARVVAGTAQPDQHPAGIALSTDGFGIVVGFPDAPVQLELFTEPQCDHCAHFQATFGEDIRSEIQSGRLAVTYRLLTFFDDSDTGYSHTVSNALFLAERDAEGEWVRMTYAQVREQVGKLAQGLLDPIKVVLAPACQVEGRLGGLGGHHSCVHGCSAPSSSTLIWS